MSNFDVRDYDLERVSTKLTRYLHVGPVLCSGVYLLLVFGGRRWMKDKQPFNINMGLGPLMLLWTAALSIFSTVAAIILGAPLIRNCMHNGFGNTVCDSDILRVPWLSFWSYLFVLSKLVAFGDTAFNVLRKSPPYTYFLHCFVRITALWYSWYSLATKNTGWHWFAVTNVAVHSVMYTCYALSLSGCRIPSFVQISIGILHVAQFVFGPIILLAGAWAFATDRNCGMNGTHLIAGCLMYGSHFLVFLNFYYSRLHVYQYVPPGMDFIYDNVMDVIR
jgi:elongation of very long chain fatty acids protein 6